MPRLPSVLNAYKFPATSILGAAAIAASLYWWSGGDIQPFVESIQWPSQPWRLVTSTLPHINILHLLFNLYWLWAFGTFLEQRFGTLKVALIYIFLAAVSGAAEFAFLRGGVGLSGIGYGLFGLFFVMARHDPEYAQILTPKDVQVFVGWYFLCIVTTILKIMPIGNIAHGVGAIAGYLLGAAIASSHQRRMLVSGALALLAVLCLGFASVGREYVNLSGDASHIHWQRGLDAFQKGDNDAAVREFQRAAEIDPSEGALWFNLGIAQERLYHWEQGADAYQHAWDLGMHDENTRRVLFEVYTHLGEKASGSSDWPNAERYYNAALRVDDTPPEIWQSVSDVYLAQGKKAQAIQALQNAAARSSDPKYRELLDSLKKSGAAPEK